MVLLQEIYTILIILGVLVTLIGSIATPIVIFSKRLAYLEAVDRAQEFKINAIWEWAMRAALHEGLSKGILERNSPMRVTDKARPYYASLAAELRRFYRQLPPNISDTDLQIQMSSRFGKRLWEEVCVPLSVDHGSCLLAAIEIAKEELEVPGVDLSPKGDIEAPKLILPPESQEPTE